MADVVFCAPATQLIIDRATREGGKRIKAPRKLTTPPPKPAEDGRLRNALFRLTASQAWSDDIRDNITGGKNGIPGPRIPYKSGDKMTRELDAQKVYPPGGKPETLMVVCQKCGERWFPPQYIVGRECWCTECVENSRAPVDRDTVKKSSGDETPIRARAMAWIDETKVWDVLDVEGEEPEEVPAHETTTSSPVGEAIMALEDRDAVLIEMPMESEEVGVLKAQIARYLAGTKGSRIITVLAEG